MKLLFLSIFLAALTGTINLHESPVAETPDLKAKNVILLIGDGMGLSHISASVYEHQSIALEKFPVIGFQKTHALNNLITDSAASGTAMASGVKTKNNVIGMDEDGNPVPTILEEAEERGYATGLIATSSIVHATPASFISHQKTRNLYEFIAADFLKTEIDLFIGGGKQFFDRRKSDDRDLIEELKSKGYYVSDYFRKDLWGISIPSGQNFAYFTADNQPIPAMQGREYLPFATKKALNYLKQKSENGFFLMVEASQIDWSGHANQATPLLDELRDFDQTIQVVWEFAKQNPETLVIVTADHETGGTALNPGSKMGKVNLTFTTNGHTGAMVPVFAHGPGSKLFGGIYDNTEIYHKMRSAFGFKNPVPHLKNK